MFSFLTVGLALLVGAMLPGPDFVVVSRNAAMRSCKAGMWAAVGVGTAVIVHATYSIAGLGLAVAHWPLLYDGIRYSGSCYLAYLGVRLLIAKRATLSETGENKRWHPPSQSLPFVEGFFTNLLNPKAIFFFVGIFSQVIGREVSLLTKTAFVLEAGVVVGGWFLVLVMLLNIPRVSIIVLHAQHPLEKMMGVLLIGFAIRLLIGR